MSHVLKSLGLILTISLGMGGIGLLQKPQLVQLKQDSLTLSPEEITSKVELEKLRLNLLQKIPAFGFENLLADWVILQFLQYFGDNPARAQTGYELSLDYFDIIVDRDPRFLQAYYFLATSGSLYGAMPERATALMEKGLESVTPKVPDRAYFILRHKGINELLFLGDGEAARRSFAQAAEWASLYEDEEGQQAAAISQDTAQFLAKNPASRSAQIQAWMMIYNTVADERTRKISLSRIQQLGGRIVQTPEGRTQIFLPQQD